MEPKIIEALKNNIIEGIKSFFVPELNKLQLGINGINNRLDKVEIRPDAMDKRLDDINARFMELRTDMNKRFDDQSAAFNKRFDDLQASIREIRSDLKSKADIVYFQKLETGYLELLGEVDELKRRAA